MSMQDKGPWTPTRIADLKRWWAEGLSAHLIAEKFNHVMSRNSVIAKVHRLGLARRRPSGAPKSRKIRSDRKRIHKPAAQAEPDMRKALKSAAINFHSGKPYKAPRKLDYRTAPEEDRPCQWPIGEPQDRDFHFCGANAVESRPYCREHCSMAYVSYKAYKSANSDSTQAGLKGNW